jgi:hypothetical protein
MTPWQLLRSYYSADASLVSFDLGMERDFFGGEILNLSSSTQISRRTTTIPYYCDCCVSFRPNTSIAFVASINQHETTTDPYYLLLPQPQE